MKKFLSATLGGALLLLGAGAVDASPLIDTGGTNFEGYAAITGFRPVGGVYNGQFNISLSQLSGTLNFTDVSQQNVHIKAFGTVIFDRLATGPGNINENAPFPDTFNQTFNGQTVFEGLFGADWPVSSVTFGPTSTPSLAVGDMATIFYNGTSSLFDVILPPGLGPVANTPLTLTVTAVGSQNLTLSVQETCNPAAVTCLEEVLTVLDTPPPVGYGSPGTLNSITGAFRINGRLVVPEPASLALMGIGIAGLGFIRRKKAA